MSELYYEKNNITQASEVKETYEYAKQNNIKFYRAVTAKGEYFGWGNGTYVKAKEGQEWFINPHYVEPKTEAAIEPEIKSVEAIEPAAEEAVERVAEVAVGATDKPTEAVAEGAVDYKALYEEASTELKQYKAQYTTVKAELESIKNAFAVLAAQIKEAAEKAE